MARHKSFDQLCKPSSNLENRYPLYVTGLPSAYQTNACDYLVKSLLESKMKDEDRDQSLNDKSKMYCLRMRLKVRRQSKSTSRYQNFLSCGFTRTSRKSKLKIVFSNHIWFDIEIKTKWLATLFLFFTESDIPQTNDPNQPSVVIPNSAVQIVVPNEMVLSKSETPLSNTGKHHKPKILRFFFFFERLIQFKLELFSIFRSS